MEQEAKIILNELLPRLKKKGLSIEQSPITPEQISLLVSMKKKGIIDHRKLREILNILFEG